MLEASRKLKLAACMCATFALAALPSTAAAAIDSKAQMNGAGFSDACTRPSESWVSFCNGYLQAVVDSISSSDEICIPAGTTRTDLVTIAEKEITASARLKGMNAHAAVLSVLRRQYPCR
jgi:hypothetical protein